MAPHPISATRAGGMSYRYPVIRRTVELWSRSTFESGKDAFSQRQLGDGFDDARTAMPLSAVSATASSSDHVSGPDHADAAAQRRGSVQTSLEEPAVNQTARCSAIDKSEEPLRTPPPRERSRCYERPGRAEDQWFACHSGPIPCCSSRESARPHRCQGCALGVPRRLSSDRVEVEQITLREDALVHQEIGECWLNDYVVDPDLVDQRIAQGRPEGSGRELKLAASTSQSRSSRSAS